MRRLAEGRARCTRNPPISLARGMMRVSMPVSFMRVPPVQPARPDVNPSLLTESVTMAQRLKRAHAAIDAQAGAGDEAAFVRGEEQHQAGDVRGLAVAAEGDGRGEGRPGGFGVLPIEAR